MKLKFPKSKKAIFLATTTALLVTGTPAIAAFSDLPGMPNIGGTLSSLIKAEKLTVFGLPAQNLASYVSADGKINFNTIFTDVSKRAYDAIKGAQGNSGDVAWVKTAGDQMADFNQDKNEVFHQNNTNDTSDAAKFFKDGSDKVEQTVTNNKTPSDSSLEATNKSNELAAANLSMNQQLTNATLKLTTAQQIQNTLALEKGQRERTDRLKGQINSGFADNEYERLQVVATRRYYPDGSGGMVDAKADETTKVFNGK